MQDFKKKQNKYIIDGYKKLETSCREKDLKIKELTILNEAKKVTKQSELQEKHEVVIK